MTVAELIAELQKMPQDMPALIYQQWAGEWTDDIQPEVDMAWYEGNKIPVVKLR